jgi:hypothetical protein
MHNRLTLALTAAAATAALTVVASPGSPPPATRVAAPASGPLLGVTSHGERLELVRVNPATLKPLRLPRLAAGSPACAPRSGGQMCSSLPPWSLSPGRAKLALARNRGAAAESVAIVERAHLRVLDEMALGGGPVGLVALLRGRRVIALQERCCDESQQLLALDVRNDRVLASRPLDGSVLRVARTHRAFVALVAPTNAIGPARLVIANRDGAIREVTLERVRAGIQLVDPAGHRTRQRVPGLAADRTGRRAFVVATGLVAEIDLRDLRISYHALGRERSLWERVHDWVEPAAEAKSSGGPVRSAIWLDTGALAVTGAGLTLIDARDWTASTVDREATDVRVAGDLLLATGGPRGLAAYGLDGRERFRLFGGEAVYVAQTYAGRAYVGAAGADRLRVVDLAAGRAVGERAADMPWLVFDAPSSWWD